MEPEQIEEVDDEKIIYEWSPPTGQKQEFFYKGYPITREQVKEDKRKQFMAADQSNQVNKMFDNSKIRECRGHKEKVHTVAWNCDGRKLASGSVDKTARVWTPHRGV